MKIQINSLAALERLLGDDNELQFEIRKNVANEFIKKHFKTMLSETVKECFDDKSKSVKENVRYHLQGEFRALTSKAIESELRTKVKAEIKKQIENFADDETFAQAVKLNREHLDTYYTKLSEEFEKKLLTMANNFLQKEFIPNVITPLITNAVKLAKGD